MPKKPKEDCKEADEPLEAEDNNVWREDQKNHRYYYDDAHGYEMYVEDEDEDKNDDE